ncbi:MAG: hypothetical protein IIC53_05415 [Proteobacteria bacterium]|nr:hypothetical protein [Pseudomonadota bacterium]
MADAVLFLASDDSSFVSGEALVGGKIDEAAISRAALEAKKITDPASDLRGPADYRTHVAGVMVQRAIAAALARANG